jgi:hypothetical protein
VSAECVVRCLVEAAPSDRPRTLSPKQTATVPPLPAQGDISIGFKRGSFLLGPNRTTLVGGHGGDFGYVTWLRGKRARRALSDPQKIPRKIRE